MERILLIGAGALATDLYEQLIGIRGFSGAFVEPRFATQPDFHGLPLFTDWAAAAAASTHYVLAVADIRHRDRLRREAGDHGLPPCEPLLSVKANLSRSATVSPGCVIGPFCWVGAYARFGIDCLLMNHIIAGHDSDVGANTVFCPGSNFAGNTRIGACTFVGSNAVIAPGVSIGAGSFVAAGAACLRDGPESSYLIGNPARRIAR
jgi:acetyltransferase-like isoleucine patch superfamily enzyme